VRTGGGEEELVPYRSSLSREGGGSAEATVFGKFRQDALYLLPLHAALQKAELIADFAAHRSGFTLMQWVGGPAGAVSVPSRALGDAERAALESFARREYPELFAQ
jgi:hypothetical protein